MTPTDESFTADTAAAGVDTAADVAADPAAAHSSGCPEERATVILLVRHGATATTGSVLPGRAPGLHLAAAGRDQARRVGERLLERHAREPIRALYSSPLERAHETAEASAQALGLPVQIEPSLLECEVGEWTGRSLSELSALPEWRTVQSSPSTFRFPGGESFLEMQDRMVATMDRLRSAHPGGTVVCFSHADPIRSLLAHALGGPLDSMQRLSVSPCSVSAVLYRDAANPVVLLTNSSSQPLAELTAQ